MAATATRSGPKTPFWLELAEEDYRRAVSEIRVSATRQDFAERLNLVDPWASRFEEPVRHLRGPQDDTQERDGGSAAGGVDPVATEQFLDWAGGLRVKARTGSSTLRDFIAQGVVRYTRNGEDLDTLPQLAVDLGNLLLSGADGGEVRLADVLGPEALYYMVRHDFKPRGGDWSHALLGLPLERQPYGASKVKAAMEVGTIPPNFVHTWAVDLTKDVKSFGLSFASPQDCVLQWGADSLTIIDACGNVLATFKTIYDFSGATVKLTDQTCALDSKTSRKRLYFLLETSSVRVKRAFRLAKLRLQSPKSASTEALLVDDPVNYKTTGIFVGAQGATLYAPWYSSSPTGSMAVLPKPDAAKGWHLLSANVTNAASQFYHLAYYNELESKLRFYLFNRNLPKPVSSFAAEVRLFAKTGQAQGIPQYEALEGPLFAQGVRPKDWSVARIPISKWEQGRWTYFEVPFFYPMAKKLPLAAAPSTQVGMPYFALYEDALKQGLRNVKLEIRVVWELALDETSQLVGKALGNATQTTSKASLADWASAIWEGVKKGVDWGKSTNSFLDSLDKYSNDQKYGSIASALLKGTIPGMAMGVYSGIAAAAGCVVSLLTGILSDSEPLRMSLELGIRGEITGVAQAKLQHATAWFYLPGRLSIKEAFDSQGVDGLPNGNFGFIDSVLPRYSRTMGLFGYKYDPTEIYLPVDMMEKLRQACYPVDRKVTTPLTHAFPLPNTTHHNAKDVWQLPTGMAKTLPRLLPVIRNEFAPSMLSMPNVTQAIPGGSKIFVKVFYDATDLWHDCGGCVWTPKVEQPEGVGMIVTAWRTPETYSAFADEADVPFEYGAEPVSFNDGVYKWSDGWRHMLSWMTTQEKDDTDIYPLRDVLYYWQIGYFILTRSQK